MIDILRAQQTTVDSIADNFEIGQIYEVKDGDEPKADGLWLKTGDMVKVTGVYPYVVLVERIKGFPIRQCFIRRCWRQHLRRVE